MWSNEYGACSREEEWHVEEETLVGWRSAEIGRVFSLSTLLEDAQYTSVEIRDDNVVDEDDDVGVTDEKVATDGEVEKKPHVGYERRDSVCTGMYIFDEECTGRFGDVPGYVAGDTFCTCAELLVEVGVHGKRKCMGRAGDSGVWSSVNFSIDTSLLAESDIARLVVGLSTSICM